MPSTLWIDVTDLLLYLGQHDRPSGIQRVVFELGSALATSDPERVGFVRRFAGPTDLETVAWEDIENLFASVTQDTSRTRRTQGLLKATTIAPFNPPEQRLALLGASVRAQADVLRQFGRLAGRIARSVTHTVGNHHSKGRKTSSRPPSGHLLSEIARAGDMFFTPGSPWELDDYAETVRWLRDNHRMTFGLLVHDVFPVFHPEWCAQGVITTFTTWHRKILPLADHVFTLSSATARDLTTYAMQERIGMLSPPIRIGAGITFRKHASEQNNFPHLPAAGSYVLFVSTLEARKNHALLFRVWRRLVEERGSENAPTLIFAGRSGWLVSDLLQQLDNANWLDGKICHIPSPTDAELAALYEGCLFTIFPSLAEGWGLPVTESLLFGQPCLASGTTAIPEAGGTFVRYFDPDNAGDVLRVISETLDDPTGLAIWRERIRRQFIPPDWCDSARIILNRLH
ncbi:glycosyltransferase family 4 protein [Acetobacter conturbans]|uniref:Glycosyltransferase n=1 Tax=Acetobacter conturbans TaxID=1737472 RepID=A0ABX0JXT0_9PROT|nr:glycosyltransferase family 1 protein [Acetobacter conturbans]NHN87366.1 glycosyltransferase [Acetobacter conturbans]